MQLNFLIKKGHFISQKLTIFVLKITKFFNAQQEMIKKILSFLVYEMSMMPFCELQSNTNT